MTLGLGKCPVCREPLSYDAKLCPHCGHPFDRYGSFEGYLLAMQVERERREAEKKRIRRQEVFHRFLFIAALILVLACIAAAYFLFRSSGHSSPSTGSTKGANTIIQMPTSASSTAETTIQQYYDDVNRQNYQAAYDMWDKQGESLADFQKGYSHTKSDTLIFGDVVSQPDGTTKVFVTVIATELISGVTRQSTYKGYYIVGQRGNDWKILNGTLSRA